MMIEDEDRRSLYHATGIERLQRLETGLLQLEQQPDDPEILTMLRQEIHSLNTESQDIGLEAIATLTQYLGEILVAIQQQHIRLNVTVSALLHQGVYATGELIHEAVTGESSHVNVEQVTARLQDLMASTLISQKTDEMNERGETEASEDQDDQQIASLIDDDELRAIYYTTSKEQLQTLERYLDHLDEGPVDATLLARFQQDAHSLKGNSKAIGLEAVAELTQVIEHLVKDIQSEAIPYSAEMIRSLRYGLGVLHQFVDEAVSGASSQIELDRIIEYFMQVAIGAEVSPPELPSVPEPTTLLPDSSADIEPSLLSSAGMIADEELRECYGTSTQELLQQLQDHLNHLDEHPDNETSLTELTRIIHRVKGDAKAAAVRPVEAVACAIEAVLKGIQHREIPFESNVSDRLHRGLDALTPLVHEAVTGEPANLVLEPILQELSESFPLPGTHTEKQAETPDHGTAESEHAVESSETEIAEFEPTHEESTDPESVNITAVNESATESMVDSDTSDSSMDESATHESAISESAISESAAATTTDTAVSSALSGSTEDGATSDGGAIADVSASGAGEATGESQNWQMTPLQDPWLDNEGERAGAGNLAAINDAETTSTDVLGNGESPSEWPPDPSETQYVTEDLQDEALREIYRLTSRDRLQTVEDGLRSVQEGTAHSDVWQTLWRELHSLSNDSLVLGIDAIVDIAQSIENIIQDLQSQILPFTPEVHQCLEEGLGAIRQLVQSAITGESNDVDINQILDRLMQVPAEAALQYDAEQSLTDRTATQDNDDQPLMSFASDIQDGNGFEGGDDSTAPHNDTEGLPSGNYIDDDDELKEIYQLTSSERLQTLAGCLQQLRLGSSDDATLALLRREAHSLKGDSKAVGLENVAEIARTIEDIVKELQGQSMPFTIELETCLYDGLETIRQLIHAVISGEQSGLDIRPVIEQLVESAAAATLAGREAPPETVLTAPFLSEPPLTEPSLPDSSLTNGVEDMALPDLQSLTSHLNSIDHEQFDDLPLPTGIDDDAELREIYRTTSEERLRNLETSLLYLEKNPQDEATLATLMRELHSLKGDSRSAGIETVERLAHAVEDVLSGVQRQELELDVEVSDRLYQGLDAIKQSVQDALAGHPTSIDTVSIVDELRASLPASGAAASPAERMDWVPTLAPDTPEIDTLTVVPPVASQSEDGGLQTETVRVKTQDLDTLMVQTEDLAVTRIQISQTSTQIEQLINLWEEWQANKHRPAVSGPSYEEQLQTLILQLNSTAQQNSAKLERISETLRERVRQLQLLPLSTLFQLLPRTVRDLARQQSKEVNLIFEGQSVTADKRLLEGIKDAILHLVRNAIDHGIETCTDRETVGKPPTATLRVRAYRRGINLMIEIADDGRGLDVEKIKQTAIRQRLYAPEDLERMPINQIHELIMKPGFSTRSFITEISGRGVGLDVVRTQVEQLKGSVQIESTPGQGCLFRLQLSTTLSTANVVLLETLGIKYALPIEFMQVALMVTPEQIVRHEEQDTIIVDGQTVPVANLSDVLELPQSPVYHWMTPHQPLENDFRPCIVLKVGNDQAGFFIDQIFSQQEVVSKPLSPLLKRVRNVTGATILGAGDICLILNPSDLVKSLQRSTFTSSLIPIKPETQRKPVILLVEDSPPVRIQEQRLFEGAGYEVITATNGAEGYHKLKTREFDAVVSDVEMPHLDGLSLVTKIRKHPSHKTLPVILVTTLDSDEDRQRGADAGANAYILKGQFNQEALLETLERLVVGRSG